jgi:hypothetical protein
LFGLGHLSLWGTALLLMLLAWLPVIAARWLVQEIAWHQHTAHIGLSILLCLPALSMLLCIFLAQRAALYIGVAEALLDEQVRH